MMTVIHFTGASKGASNENGVITTSESGSGHLPRQNMFHNCTFVLEFDSFMPFKEKLRWRKKVTDYGGTISYIVAKKINYVILFNDMLEKSTFKQKQARRYHIPVLRQEFIDDCVIKGEIIPTDSYEVGEALVGKNFKHGKIGGTEKRSAVSHVRRRKQVNMNSVKSWTLDDPDCPYPNDDKYELAKWTILKSKNNVQVLEVHALTAVKQFRLLSHGGQIDNERHLSVSEDPVVWFFETSEEVLSGYEQLHRRYTTLPYSMSRWSNPVLSTNSIGSNKLKLVLGELCILSAKLTEETGQFVELVWREATNEVEKMLTIPIQHVKQEKVEDAEAALLQLKRTIRETGHGNEDEEKITSLNDKFYTSLPHTANYKKTLKSLKDVSTKQDHCQLIQDVLSVSEATDWSPDATTFGKFRALRCHVTCLDQSSTEFADIRDMVTSTAESISIVNIFEIGRTLENIRFDSYSSIGNVQTLMHSSSPHNFLGILSRGLLLPNMVEEEFGVKRTDRGKLGCGIYFADSASTSLKYSEPSSVGGYRLLLICDVALGHCKEYRKIDTRLKSPPEGYHSVHGVKGSDTDFTDDEYVIYNTNQQRVRYVVQYTISGDVTQPLVDLSLTDEGVESHSIKEGLAKIDITDIKDVTDPLTKVTAGLIGGKKDSVPLKSVHVRAKLLDMVAQVNVLQAYKNDNDSPIEAKYVFPLDDMAAVCGFEAYINGKHIIGKVKEKATAHKEYKEAISKGHGAYLMDEEEPDVFTVSVGNLPPKASVLIKITYIAELRVEGEQIVFRVPSNVAPWVLDTALAQQTQTDLDTLKVKGQGYSKASVQVAIEMPFEIRRLMSPTHQIKYKKTATKAVVELPKNCGLEDGFQLLITLAEIHVPRMWVERHPDKDSQACLLAFYPEFDASVDAEPEVIFLLDMSNSMKGQSVQDAKKVFLLAMEKLPEKAIFNLIVFGTSNLDLFPSSQRKNKNTIDKAIKFIQSLEADLGGSNALSALQSLFLLSPPEGTRSIFLISDGYLSHPETIYSFASKAADRNRVFVQGVGETPNHHLLRSLAGHGGGTYQYYNRKTKSSWEGKISCQVEKACQPGISGVEVEWIQHSDNYPRPIQAPQHIPSLFSGSRQVVYGFAQNCTQAKLKATVDGNEFSTMVSTSDLNITTGKMLHQLTARAVIRDYEDGILNEDKIEQKVQKEEKKKYIIDLSTEYSIVTPYTSFVAIEEREEDEEKTDGPSIEELVFENSVDILPYVGWMNPDVFQEKEPEDVVRELLRRGELAESFSQMEAERCFVSILDYTTALQKEENKDLKDEVMSTIKRFFKSSGLEKGQEVVKHFQSLVPEKKEVFVKTLTGRTVTLKPKVLITVKEFKEMIQDKEGIPPEQQRLVFCGKMLADHEIMDDLDLTSSQTFHLVLRLRGGPPSSPQEKESTHGQRYQSFPKLQIATKAARHSAPAKTIVADGDDSDDENEEDIDDYNDDDDDDDDYECEEGVLQGYDTSSSTSRKGTKAVTTSGKQIASKAAKMPDAQIVTKAASSSGKQLALKAARKSAPACGGVDESEEDSDNDAVKISGKHLLGRKTRKSAPAIVTAPSSDESSGASSELLEVDEELVEEAFNQHGKSIFEPLGFMSGSDDKQSQMSPSPAYNLPSTDTAYGPLSPSYCPTSPSYHLKATSYKPSSTVYSPTSPSYSPISPAYKASSLAFHPTAPAYKLSSPAYSPTSPAYCPSSPAYSPTSPAYQPIPMARGASPVSLAYKTMHLTDDFLAPKVSSHRLSYRPSLQQSQLGVSTKHYLSNLDPSSAIFDPKTRSMGTVDKSTEANASDRFGSTSVVGQEEKKSVSTSVLGKRRKKKSSFSNGLQYPASNVESRFDQAVMSLSTIESSDLNQLGGSNFRGSVKEQNNESFGDTTRSADTLGQPLGAATLSTSQSSASHFGQPLITVLSDISHSIGFSACQPFVGATTSTTKDTGLQFGLPFSEPTSSSNQTSSLQGPFGGATFGQSFGESASNKYDTGGLRFGQAFGAPISNVSQTAHFGQAFGTPISNVSQTAHFGQAFGTPISNVSQTFGQHSAPSISKTSLFGSSTSHQPPAAVNSFGGGGFTFGQSNDATVSTGFGFGQPSSNSRNTGGFSFGGHTGAPESSAPNTPGFSFGAPAPSTSQIPEFRSQPFGAPACNFGQPTEMTVGSQFQTSGFGFGKPPPTSSQMGGFSFGQPIPVPVSSAPQLAGFSFNATSPSTSQSHEFTFEKPSDVKISGATEARGNIFHRSVPSLPQASGSNVSFWKNTSGQGLDIVQSSTVQSNLAVNSVPSTSQAFGSGPTPRTPSLRPQNALGLLSTLKSLDGTKDKDGHAEHGPIRVNVQQQQRPLILQQQQQLLMQQLQQMPQQQAELLAHRTTVDSSENICDASHKNDERFGRGRRRRSRSRERTKERDRGRRERTLSRERHSHSFEERSRSISRERTRERDRGRRERTISRDRGRRERTISRERPSHLFKERSMGRSRERTKVRGRGQRERTLSREQRSHSFEDRSRHGYSRRKSKTQSVKIVSRRYQRRERSVSSGSGQNRAPHEDRKNQKKYKKTPDSVIADKDQVIDLTKGKGAVNSCASVDFLLLDERSILDERIKSWRRMRRCAPKLDHLPEHCEDGYWELTSDLTYALGLSFNSIQNVLREQGLFSLSHSTHGFAVKVLATLLVCVIKYIEAFKRAQHQNKRTVENLMSVEYQYGGLLISFTGDDIEDIHVQFPKESYRWLMSIKPEAWPMIGQLELGRNVSDFIWKLFLAML